MCVSRQGLPPIPPTKVSDFGSNSHITVRLDTEDVVPVRGARPLEQEFHSCRHEARFLAQLSNRRFRRLLPRLDASAWNREVVGLAPDEQHVAISNDYHGGPLAESISRGRRVHALVFPAPAA